MMSKSASFLQLRWLTVILLGLLLATIGNAFALGPRV